MKIRKKKKILLRHNKSFYISESSPKEPLLLIPVINFHYSIAFSFLTIFFGRIFCSFLLFFFLFSGALSNETNASHNENQGKSFNLSIRSFFYSYSLYEIFFCPVSCCTVFFSSFILVFAKKSTRNHLQIKNVYAIFKQLIKKRYLT